MLKAKYMNKIIKNIYNLTFWIYGVMSFILFLVFIVYIWIKFDFFVNSRFLSSRILESFKFGSDFIVAFLVIGFLLNMFVFNGEVKKIIDKEHYRKMATIEFVLFLAGIVFFIFSPMFFRASNLALDNYKMKTIYCLLYSSTFVGSFLFFYLFSFLNVITEDESYNFAKAYIYRIKELSYDKIYNLIFKKIGSKLKKGEFLSSSYGVKYVIKEVDNKYENVYAFISLKNIEDEFLKLYLDDRLIEFVQYLYSKVLNKSKNARIIYFICVDEYNDNFKSLIDLSIYQDEHFIVVHTLIDLKNNDLYVGGVRDEKKENIYDYILLKQEIDRILVDVIDSK